ncbi:MAG TPA: hypothetical protein VF615_01550 [Longimicrobiaceae bacterium]|jgi:hypothetical protein
MRWEPYDPAWLVALARDSRPDEPWLAEALARCTRAAEGGRAYLYFVDPARPDEPGSAWQFEENVVLHHPREGELVLDVLRDGRIGGVEFLKRL